MCQCIKPISISLSPNVQRDDVFLALKILLKSLVRKSPPSHESYGGAGKIQISKSETLADKFRKYLGAKYAFALNSGRSCLYMILKALDVKEGNEVLLQAFTCNAVPNPVLWAGAKPIYVDIDDSLNIDPEDLVRKISPKSKAIIVQNTFGVPAQMHTILDIARRNNLIVIEDCAHALGASYDGKKLGAFGDISFFSFGRDKVISSVWGGVVTTNNDEIARKIQEVCKDIPYPKKSWARKQLFHPILFSVIIPTYYIFGKYLLAFLRMTRGIGLAVSQQERRGGRPDMFPAKMPEELAEMALRQFEKLEKYNEHRKTITQVYFLELAQGLSFPQKQESQSGNYKPQIQNSKQIPNYNNQIPKPYTLQLPEKSEGAIYLRFNIRVANAKEILKKAKKKHVLLGDWYKNVIDPIGTDFEKLWYKAGSCPNAERAARESVNLPTHINISEKDALKIVEFLKGI